MHKGSFGQNLFIAADYYNKVIKMFVAMLKFLNNVISVLVAIIVFLLPFTILVAEAVGLYHSFTKHDTKDNVISIFVPPWAWYRAVESTWHDDYKNVNWEERLNDDMQVCIYFINSVYIENVNLYELNNSLDEFSEEISDYPKDKFKYLENGVKQYIKFSKSMQSDLIMGISKLRYGDNSLKFSNQTNELSNELSKMGFGDNVAYTRTSAKAMYSRFIDIYSKDLTEFSSSDLTELINTMRTSSDKSYEDAIYIYRKIFNIPFE